MFESFLLTRTEALVEQECDIIVVLDYYSVALLLSSKQLAWLLDLRKQEQQVDP
jgi:hypothetical protein